MRSTIPHVTGDRLYQSESESDPIVLGTPAWYDWLEQHTAFTFVDAAETFTARKSMLRTGGSYWKAYHRRQGKLYRIHLGHSHALTLERLQAAARAFAGKHVSGEPTRCVLDAVRCFQAPHAHITPHGTDWRPSHGPDADQTLSTTQA